MQQDRRWKAAGRNRQDERICQAVALSNLNVVFEAKFSGSCPAVLICCTTFDIGRAVNHTGREWREHPHCVYGGRGDRASC